jgi:hypothetical protein
MEEAMTRKRRSEQKTAAAMLRRLRGMNEFVCYAQMADLDPTDERVKAYILEMTQKSGTDEERLQHEIWLATNPEYAYWHRSCLSGHSRGLDKAEFFPDERPRIRRKIGSPYGGRAASG